MSDANCWTDSDIGEMVKFDRIAVRIEVRDRLGTHVRMEHEGVVAGAANGCRSAGRAGRRRISDERSAVPVRREAERLVEINKCKACGIASGGHR